MRPPHKIPTVLGLFLVILIIVLVSFFFEIASRGQIRASASTKPSAVIATNVSDTGFTVTWLTTDPTTGAVTLISPKQKEQTFFDERDLSARPTGATTSFPTAGRKLGKFVTHSIAIKNLQPNTDYFFKVLSNSKPYLNNDKPYQVRTAPILRSSPNNLEPAYGTVTVATGQPAGGAIVFLTLEGGQTLSSLVNPSGSWLIPLNLARSEDLSQYFPLTERVTENILVRSTSGGASAVTDTLNDSPVPTIVIGKTYDFRKQQAQKSNNKDLAEKKLSSPAILGKETSQGAAKVSILSPANGAALTSNLPLIQGTGVADKKVTITVGIQAPTSGTTTVAIDGLWRFTPSKPLSAGKQSVTITTVDAGGKPVAITHVFEILKSGTQVLGEATPSASLSPTATPTMSLTPEPTSSATSTLSGEPLPESGTILPALILLILGWGLLTGGAIIMAK